MRVPKQGNVWGRSFLKNFFQDRGSREIAVRFQDDRYFLRLGVVSQLAQRPGNVFDGGCLWPDKLVAKNPHVGSAEPRGKVNEPPRVGKLFLMLGPGVVHVG